MLNDEFKIVCTDDKFKKLEAEKWPWLDKGLGATEYVEVPDLAPIQRVHCQSIDQWETRKNVTGGKFLMESSSQDLEKSKREALLDEDAVGVARSRLHIWHGESSIAQVSFEGGETIDREFLEIFDDDTEVGFWKSSREEILNTNKGRCRQ